MDVKEGFTSRTAIINQISAAVEIHGRRCYAAPQWDDVFLYGTLRATLWCLKLCLFSAFPSSVSSPFFDHFRFVNLLRLFLRCVFESCRLQHFLAECCKQSKSEL